eukprot:UN09298
MNIIGKDPKPNMEFYQKMLTSTIENIPIITAILDNNKNTLKMFVELSMQRTNRALNKITSSLPHLTHAVNVINLIKQRRSQ